VTRPQLSTVCFLAAALSLPVLPIAHAEDADAVEAVAEEAVAAVKEVAAEEVTPDAPDAAPDAEVATEAAADDQPDDGFANEIDRLSYAIGVDIGSGMRLQGIDINTAILAEALTAAYNNGELRLTDEQCDVVIDRFQSEMQAKQIQKMMEDQEAAAAENTAAGEAFLNENKTKEGVVTTDSGLQYLITEKGDGPLPASGDQVTLHYIGQLVDGSVFESSRESGQPLTLGVDQFVPGFTEGVKLMPVGTKGKLFIPGELAYGMRGGPGGANATLIFDLEILSVESPKKTKLEALGD